MDFDLFRKVVDDYRKCGGVNIGFATTVGDPLVDPLLIERIEYARSAGLRGFGFFTNGIFLDRIDLHRLVRSGVGEIIISIGGFDRDTYRKVFGIDAFERVMDNIIALWKINQQYGNPVRISITVKSSVRVSEMKNTNYYKRFSSLGIPVSFNRHVDSWSGRISQEMLPSGMKLRKTPHKKVPCYMLWFGATVHSNGEFTLCGCRDLDGDSELTIGNIKAKSLYELWTSEKVKELRNSFVNNTPSICRDCSFYQPVFIMGKWERELLKE